MGDFKHSILKLLASVLIAALLTTGCRRKPEEETVPELEAVDVAPGLTIPTEDDQQAVIRPLELVGVLPDDFPDGLPLYLPASLVDFGTVDDGWVYVNLLTSHSLARVARELDARLADRGWTIANNGGVRQLRRGNSRVRLVVENARPGTQYRFEYPG